MQVRVFVATAAMALLGAVASQAGPSPHMRSQFGMIGLAVGQTARLSAVVIDNPNIIDDPNIRVELMFLDANGDPVLGREGLPVRLTVQLTRGRSAFLDLDFGEVNPPEGDRVQVRAVIRATILGRAGRRRDIADTPALGTLEIFDRATGRTQLILEPGATQFIKEIDPSPQG